MVLTTTPPHFNTLIRDNNDVNALTTLYIEWLHEESGYSMYLSQRGIKSLP